MLIHKFTFIKYVNMGTIIFVATNILVNRLEAGKTFKLSIILLEKTL